MTPRRQHLSNTLAHLRTWHREKRAELVAAGAADDEADWLLGPVVVLLDSAEPLLASGDLDAAEGAIGKALGLSELVHQCASVRPVRDEEPPETMH